jgi:archaeosine synthase beta-subunit
VLSVFPAHGRTAWISAQRPARGAALDPFKPHSFFLEDELSASGRTLRSIVILLTNKECPWRCLMCDLWKNTLTQTVPPGAIAAQIEFALERVLKSPARLSFSSSKTPENPRTRTRRNRSAEFSNALLSELRMAEAAGAGRNSANRTRPAAAGEAPAEQVKLYNSGSFFDPGAIPLDEYSAIAGKVSFAEQVLVESHPRLVGKHALNFRDLLSGSLEVALGLETVHPEVLPRLNKKFDLTHFAQASEFLRTNGISVRAFVLVKPPFMTEPEGIEWAVKSAAFAFDCGATAVSMIPARLGNGALERLMSAGEFGPPRLSSLETALEQGLALRVGRVFADTWNLGQFSSCMACFDKRRKRLETMNLIQRVLPAATCPECGAS